MRRRKARRPRTPTSVWKIAAGKAARCCRGRKTRVSGSVFRRVSALRSPLPPRAGRPKGRPLRRQRLTRLSHLSLASRPTHRSPRRAGSHSSRPNRLRRGRLRTCHRSRCSRRRRPNRLRRGRLRMRRRRSRPSRRTARRRPTAGNRRASSRISPPGSLRSARMSRRLPAVNRRCAPDLCAQLLHLRPGGAAVRGSAAPCSWSSPCWPCCSAR